MRAGPELASAHSAHQGANTLHRCGTFKSRMSATKQQEQRLRSGPTQGDYEGCFKAYDTVCGRGSHRKPSQSCMGELTTPAHMRIKPRRLTLRICAA